MLTASSKNTIVGNVGQTVIKGLMGTILLFDLKKIQITVSLWC